MCPRLRMVASSRSIFTSAVRHASNHKTTATSSIPPKIITSKIPPPRPTNRNSKSSPKPESKPSNHSYRVALYLINGFLVLHLVTTYIVVIRPCEGPSMLPTIAWNGDWIVISKLHRFGRLGVDVGDLISYHHPVRQGFSGIKRVVGMPGDFVLRDTPRDTYRLRSEEDGNAREQWMVQIPEGHCWIVGDNLESSRDSRHFGPLPLALVKGKVMARFWPKPAWFANALQEPDP